MDPATLLTLVGQCAGPENPPALVYAVAKAESGGHPFIIRDNTTGIVHHFHSYSTALTFVKAHSHHSLDIGLMQVNTKAHRGDPARLLSPCGNIRIGSGILKKDAEAAGGRLRPTLCLYHRGKRYCGSYPEKVGVFLSRPTLRNRPMNVILAKRPFVRKLPLQGGIPKRKNPVLDLADATQGTADPRGDPDSELDSQFKFADVDGFIGR